MTYSVKWTIAGRDETAIGHGLHHSPQTAFQYADVVAEVLSAMGVDDPTHRVWVEDAAGHRIERLEKTTDS